MKTLNKTLYFIKLIALLSDKLNELAISKTQTTLSFDCCLRSISLSQFLHHLQTCSAETISAELVELCLTTTQLQLFFKLVDGQIKRTAAQIGNIPVNGTPTTSTSTCRPINTHSSIGSLP